MSCWLNTLTMFLLPFMPCTVSNSSFRRLPTAIADFNSVCISCNSLFSFKQHWCINSSQLQEFLDKFETLSSPRNVLPAIQQHQLTVASSCMYTWLRKSVFLHICIFFFFWSQESIVSVVTRLRPGWYGVQFLAGQQFYFPAEWPNQFWDSPSLLVGRHQRFFLREKAWS